MYRIVDMCLVLRFRWTLNLSSGHLCTIPDRHCLLFIYHSARGVYAMC